MAQGNPSLVHIRLVNQVHAGHGLVLRLVEGFRRGLGRRPGAEGLIQFGEHLGSPEVAGHRHDHVARMNVLAMKRQHVVPGDRLERRGVGVAVDEVFLPVHQEVPLEAFDRTGRVVPPLDVLQAALPRLPQTLLVEAGIAQHVNQQRQGFIDVLRQARNAGGALGVVNAGMQRGGQKLQLLVEFRGRQALRASVAQLLAGQRSQPRLLGWIEGRPGADQNHHVEGWQFAVLRDVYHHPVGQHLAELCRWWNLVLQRRVLEFAGVGRDRCFRVDRRRSGDQDDSQ